MKAKIMQYLKGNKKTDGLGASFQEIDICTYSMLQIAVCEYKTHLTSQRLSA
jgi:hypothetical protein